jgi:hypothetical protein
MSVEETTIEGLRRWGQILLWVSVILPVFGAIAAGARYYVERYEKQISSKLTASAIQTAKNDAAEARVQLEGIHSGGVV